jgi:hypothetical protein
MSTPRMIAFFPFRLASKPSVTDSWVSDRFLRAGSIACHAQSFQLFADFQSSGSIHSIIHGHPFVRYLVKGRKKGRLAGPYNVRCLAPSPAFGDPTLRVATNAGKREILGRLHYLTHEHPGPGTLQIYMAIRCVEWLTWTHAINGPTDILCHGGPESAPSGSGEVRIQRLLSKTRRWRMMFDGWVDIN